MLQGSNVTMCNITLTPVKKKLAGAARLDKPDKYELPSTLRSLCRVSARAGRFASVATPA